MRLSLSRKVRRAPALRATGSERERSAVKRTILLSLALVGALALPRARAEGPPPPDVARQVALLVSAATGDPLVVPLVERGEIAAAPVVSFIIGRVPEGETDLARVAEVDRAAVLRGETVLAHLGKSAVPSLIRALESEHGPARRAALARAL